MLTKTCNIQMDIARGTRRQMYVCLGYPLLFKCYSIYKSNKNNGNIHKQDHHIRIPVIALQSIIIGTYVGNMYQTIATIAINTACHGTSFMHQTYCNSFGSYYDDWSIL